MEASPALSALPKGVHEYYDSISSIMKLLRPARGFRFLGEVVKNLSIPFLMKQVFLTGRL